MSDTGMKHTGTSLPGKEDRAPAPALKDLNQPLTAIGNYVQAGRRLMDRGYADEQTLTDLFDKLDGQVNRCYELLKELRNAVKPGNDDDGASAG